MLFTGVEGDDAGRKVLVLESGGRVGDGLDEAVARFDELIRRGRNQLLTLDDGSKVFAEWYGPPPRLFVYGAVDTAEAMCRGAKLIGWHSIVADARARFATRERNTRRDSSASVRDRTRSGSAESPIAARGESPPRSVRDPQTT